MNKKFLAFGILGVLALFVVSAAIVNYLSAPATANIEVAPAMVVAFTNMQEGIYTTYPVNINGANWESSMEINSTTQLSTSFVGVKVDNNADVNIEGKYLALTVSNSLNDVSCDDITSLKFLDTGTQIQIDKGYQELAGVGLCVDNGNTIVYNIPINSLMAKTTYQYPSKITFGVVEPSTYTFNAQMIITP